MPRGVRLLLCIACALSASSAGVVAASEPRSREIDSRPDQRCASLAARARERDEAAATPVQIELADCYAQAGMTASAWRQYLAAAQVARAAGSAELEGVCRTHATALEAELSYLTVETWKGQRVELTRDGAPVSEAVVGTAVPVDPGQHAIAASAPGKRPWTTQVSVGDAGDHVLVSVPVLPDAIQLEAQPTSSAELDRALTREREAATEAETGSLQRTLALVSGAVGIAGVAAGTVFGLKAASDWNDVKAQCKPYPYCGEDGSRLAREAKHSALISNVGFATGALGLTAGAVLWFTAPAAEHKAASIGVGVGRVMLRGPL